MSNKQARAQRQQKLRVTPEVKAHIEVLHSLVRPGPRFIRPEDFMGALEPVTGQLDLKRKLASAFSQYTAFRSQPSVGRPLVLVLGPSGTGKTFAIELLCRATGLPFTSVSAASMAMTAHKGLTFRDLLVQHITDFKTDEGIIFVDEIDKWCKGAIGSGDSETIAMGNRMQAEALRMMTAEKAVLADEMELEEGDTEEAITFRTAKTMWVLAGAFVGIDHHIRDRFNNPFFYEEDVWKEVTPSDLIHYGMITELVGRIQTIAWVKPLNINEMMDILESQEVPRWKVLFSLIGCELTIERGALSTCADRAKQEGTGVRGAVAFLRRGMEDIYHECSHHKIQRISIDRAAIETGHVEYAA